MMHQMTMQPGFGQKTGFSGQVTPGLQQPNPFQMPQAPNPLQMAQRPNLAQFQQHMAPFIQNTQAGPFGIMSQFRNQLHQKPLMQPPGNFRNADQGMRTPMSVDQPATQPGLGGPFQHQNPLIPFQQGQGMLHRMMGQIPSMGQNPLMGLRQNPLTHPTPFQPQMHMQDFRQPAHRMPGMPQPNFMR